jgi:F420 biosynthesis protein FbiB-like protein
MDNTQKLAVLELIQSRRSLRRYRPEPVSRALIERLLLAANWSPSAHNRQPWRFVVLESGHQKEALALAMAGRLRQDLLADGAAAQHIEADTQRSYERLTAAPVIILMCLSMIDMDQYADHKRGQAEYLMAVQSVAMAGQNLLLAAHEAGLGACWLCAPLFCPDVVAETLGLPQDWQPQGLITLGYPAQTREKTRDPVEAKTLWR